MTMHFEWTDDRVNELKALRATGLSCAQIGAALGLIRNAVMGKLHRIGMSGRDKPRACRVTIRRERRPSLRPRKPKAMRRMPLEQLADVAPVEFQPRESRAVHLDIPFADMGRDKCWYPTGETPHRFCGQPVVAHTSWCADCTVVVFAIPRRIAMLCEAL